MSENKLNVVVPKDYNGTPIEVVLREGEAPVVLDPKEPERVVISVTKRTITNQTSEVN